MERVIDINVINKWIPYLFISNLLNKNKIDNDVITSININLLIVQIWNLAFGSGSLKLFLHIQTYLKGLPGLNNL